MCSSWFMAIRLLPKGRKLPVYVSCLFPVTSTAFAAAFRRPCSYDSDRTLSFREHILEFQAAASQRILRLCKSYCCAPFRDSTLHRDGILM